MFLTDVLHHLADVLVAQRSMEAQEHRVPISRVLLDQSADRRDRRYAARLQEMVERSHTSTTLGVGLGMLPRSLGIYGLIDPLTAHFSEANT